jgi:DNA-binding MarR family transcriptional regulator
VLLKSTERKCERESVEISVANAAISLHQKGVLEGFWRELDWELGGWDMIQRRYIRTEKRRRRRRAPNRIPGVPEAAWVARRRISHRGKTLRAYRTYLDLLDTTRHMHSELKGQMAAFDLTPRGFRLLELLYRHGPTSIAIAAKKLECSRQNVCELLGRLGRRGWVERELWTLPPKELQESRLPVKKRGKRRKGRLFGVIRLTKRGKDFIGTVFPKHAKVVKSLLRTLDGREQVTLSRLLQKVREGDLVRFIREIRMYDEEDWKRVAGAAGVELKV